MTKRCESDSIFITGSNGYLLSGELSTDLTGRHIECEIGTLTFDGYLGMKEYFRLPVEKSNLSAEFGKYIHEGGLPRAVLLDNPQDEQEIIKEIFEKDIRRNKKIRNREPFDAIQTDIIDNFGSKTSIGSLCEYLSKTRKEPIEKDTVFHYLGILGKAKTISECERFDMKGKKSINGEEDENGVDRTQERECRSLEHIQDNDPEYILSLDYPWQRRSGILRIFRAFYLVGK